MITKKQLHIFKVFARKPFAELTRKDIKELSEEKSNNALAMAMETLKGEGSIMEKKVGRSGLYSLNLNNDLAYYYLALANDGMLGPLARGSLGLLRKELADESPFFSIVIFGSYAACKQGKGSDVDIAVFIESEHKKKSYEACGNSARLKSPVEMDLHIISRQDMIEMLTDKDENLGKQIARKHLAVHNHRIFYDLVREGMMRGFRV